MAEGASRITITSSWRELSEAETSDGTRLQGLGDRTAVGASGDAGQRDCLSE